MPRGLNRTVIMSHGKNHDALGVRGTHLAGSVPDPAVLAAIPEGLGAVGYVPSPVSVPAAKAPASARAEAVTAERVLPGGPSTSRPSVESTTGEPEAPPALPQPRGGAVPPPPDSAPASVPDAISTGATALAALNITKRKLKRASLPDLTKWCGLAGINPKEYVENDGDPITGGLMRQLLAEHLNID